MIYGDNPNKINEREDALGLKAYTYTPSISSIMQSGNLYVYGINNPVQFTDYSGNVITLAAVGMFALRHVVVPIVTQVVSDVLIYAYDNNPNKEFKLSSFGTYAWACVSSTFSFGISNPLLKTATESIVSSLGGEIVYGFEATITGEELHTVSDVRANLVASFVGDLVVEEMFLMDEFLDESIPSSTPKNQRNSSASYHGPDAVRDTVESTIKILPQAYKSAIVNTYNNNKNIINVLL